MTSSATASTSFMLPPVSYRASHPDSRPPSWCQSLHHAQVIDAVAASIRHLIHQIAHKMQAHAAGFALRAGEIGRRCRERVERLAVVLHNRFDVAGTQRNAHRNLMMPGVLVAVGNDI